MKWSRDEGCSVFVQHESIPLWRENATDLHRNGVKWCRDNKIWYRIGYFSIHFTNEKDLTWFLLRWA